MSLSGFINCVWHCPWNIPVATRLHPCLKEKEFAKGLWSVLQFKEIKPNFQKSNGYSFLQSSPIHFKTCCLWDPPPPAPGSHSFFLSPKLFFSHWSSSNLVTNFNGYFWVIDLLIYSDDTADPQLFFVNLSSITFCDYFWLFWFSSALLIPLSSTL